MNEPQTARTDPQAPAALRQGIELLAAVDHEYDVAAGIAQFEARVGAASGAARGSRVTLVVVTTLMVALAGVVGVAGTRGSATASPESSAQSERLAEDRSNHEDAPPTAASREPSHLADRGDAVVDRDAAAIRPELARDERASEPSVSASLARANPRDSAAVERRRARAPRPAVAERTESEDDSLAREMRLLNAARRHVVANEAAAALSSIRVARASIPVLSFDEEWDALEILALAAADRLGDAERRAESFLAAHPNGRFAASIERALAQARERSGP